jgi:hypothetical protein
MSEPHIRETEHFCYRVQDGGVLTHAQRGSMAFGIRDGAILLSEDNGATWPRTLPFNDAERITFSCILGNGNVLFATYSGLWLASEEFSRCRQITVQQADGSDYLPHTSVASDLPGWYFHSIPGVNAWQTPAGELAVWGNLCSVLGGAAPVNIYYSADGGDTVRIAYSFGQNPHTRDNGTPTGGAEGTLLGDPATPVIARHVHCVGYNPAEDAFYACTGDGDRPEGFECHWLRGTYDWEIDRWDWRVIHSDHLNTRYKSGGINFRDGQLYFISDANGPEPYDRGIFGCAPEDLPHPSRHTLLYDPGVECACMLIEDDVVLAAHLAPATPLNTGIIISLDGGKSFAEHDLAELGKRSPMRLHPPNSEGWFRMDLRQRWFDPGEVLFLKPKVT